MAGTEVCEDDGAARPLHRRVVLTFCRRFSFPDVAPLNLAVFRVIRTLERVVAWRGCPSKLRLDNGPEFIALTLAEWSERKGITLDLIEPGRPLQNGFIDRSNGGFRHGVLDMHVFRHLAEVREQAESWLADHSRAIPYDRLFALTPSVIAIPLTARLDARLATHRRRVDVVRRLGDI